ncbi:MAG: hypothetical protein WC438_03185 [Candidatus Pacearchaeota archaeon]
MSISTEENYINFKIRKFAQISKINFPDEHLGIADRFLFNRILIDTYSQLKNDPDIGISGQAFINCLIRQMNNYGYQGKLIIPDKAGGCPDY